MVQGVADWYLGEGRQAEAVALLEQVQIYRTFGACFDAFLRFSPAISDSFVWPLF